MERLTRKERYGILATIIFALLYLATLAVIRTCRLPATDDSVTAKAKIEKFKAATEALQADTLPTKRRTKKHPQKKQDKDRNPLDYPANRR